MFSYRFKILYKKVIEISTYNTQMCGLGNKMQWRYDCISDNNS